MRTTAALVFACFIAAPSSGQQQERPASYLVKLGVPVSTGKSKAGDRIRAAVISPESLLNGYLEGTVGDVKPGRLVLRFTALVYKGTRREFQSEVVDFVNSKGHKSVDDHERPIRLEQGAFSSAEQELWLDEGSELRVRTISR